MLKEIEFEIQLDLAVWEYMGLLGC